MTAPTRARCEHEYGDGLYGPHRCKLSPGHAGEHYCCGQTIEDAGKPDWPERLATAEQRAERAEAKLATIDCGDCGHTMLDCQCGAKTSDPGDPRLCSYRVRRSMERLAKVLTPKGGT